MSDYTLEEVIDFINGEIEDAYTEATRDEKYAHATKIYKDALNNSGNLGKYVSRKTTEEAKKMLDKKQYDKIAKLGAGVRASGKNASDVVRRSGKFKDFDFEDNSKKNIAKAFIYGNKNARDAKKVYGNKANEKERRKSLKEGYKMLNAMATVESVSYDILEAYELGVISYEAANDYLDMLALFED
jgi:hypothetical protein